MAEIVSQPGNFDRWSDTDVWVGGVVPDLLTDSARIVDDCFLRNDTPLVGKTKGIVIDAGARFDHEHDTLLETSGNITVGTGGLLTLTGETRLSGDLISTGGVIHIEGLTTFSGVGKGLSVDADSSLTIGEYAILTVAEGATVGIAAGAVVAHNGSSNVGGIMTLTNNTATTVAATGILTVLPTGSLVLAGTTNLVLSGSLVNDGGSIAMANTASIRFYGTSAQVYRRREGGIIAIIGGHRVVDLTQAYGFGGRKVME